MTKVCMTAPSPLRDFCGWMCFPAAVMTRSTAVLKKSWEVTYLLAPPCTAKTLEVNRNLALDTALTRSRTLTSGASSIEAGNQYKTWDVIATIKRHRHRRHLHDCLPVNVDDADGRSNAATSGRLHATAVSIRPARTVALQIRRQRMSVHHQHPR